MSQRTVISSIVVEAVRAACLEAALLAYEDAGAAYEGFALARLSHPGATRRRRLSSA